MDDCIFCKIANGDIPSATIYEDRNVRVILDIAPAAKGHAIMIPKTHMADIFDADAETISKISAAIPMVASAIKKELGCDGINILQNNGAAAGQTVNHLHIHFIPRYNNDNVKIGWEQGSYADGEAAELAKKIASRV